MEGNAASSSLPRARNAAVGAIIELRKPTNTSGRVWLEHFKQSLGHLGLTFEQVLRQYPGVFTAQAEGGTGARKFWTTLTNKCKDFDLRIFKADENR